MSRLFWHTDSDTLIMFQAIAIYSNSLYIVGKLVCDLEWKDYLYRKSEQVKNIGIRELKEH